MHLTFQWNEVISLFRSGMPVKKHRLRFKLHHDCFTGLDAVDWLHDLLKANSNFSANVSTLVVSYRYYVFSEVGLLLQAYQ